MHVLTFSPEN